MYFFKLVSIMWKWVEVKTKKHLSYKHRKGWAQDKTISVQTPEPYCCVQRHTFYNQIQNIQQTSHFYSKLSPFKTVNCKGTVCTTWVHDKSDGNLCSFLMGPKHAAWIRSSRIRGKQMHLWLCLQAVAIMDKVIYHCWLHNQSIIKMLSAKSFIIRVNDVCLKFWRLQCSGGPKKLGIIAPQRRCCLITYTRI